MSRVYEHLMELLDHTKNPSDETNNLKHQTQEAKVSPKYNHHHRGVTPPTEGMKDVIVQAMVASVLKANRVFSRDHIIPEKVVRAGEFATQLRRELQYKIDNKDVIGAVTTNGVWRDLLEPDESYIESGRSPWIEELCVRARQQLKQHNPAEIEAAINGLEGICFNVSSLLTTMKSINVEAVECRQGFETLAKDMAE